MKPCAWCDKESVTELELEPIRYRTITKKLPDGTVSKRQELAALPIKAAACEQHSYMLEKRGAGPVGNWRAKKAKGVEQLTIFDVPGVEQPGPASAITRDDVA